MARRVQVRLAAPPDEVRECVDRVVGTSHPLTTLDVDVRAEGDQSAVTLSSRLAVRIPYFGWFVRILAWVAARRELEDLAGRLRAEVEGTAPPPVRRASLVLPPVRFGAEQAASLATVAAVGVVANFGGALFTQDGDAVTRSFGRSDQDLGFALALTRAGVLVALVATALADRYGRRRLVLWGLAGIGVANAVAALAPTFEVFTVSQVLARAFVNATLVVAAIVAIEEAPEGARAFALSMFGLALGLGFGVSVLLLPIADLGGDAWRASFAVSALTVVALPSLARNLSETGRFERMASRRSGRSRRVRLRELWGRPYGRRFLALGAVAFLVNVFSAPSSQLTNRYLTRAHHFSNSGVAVFRGVTAGVPGVVGVLLAGRLAETRGRRPVSIIGLLVATVAQMVFFLTAGAVLWVTAVVSIVAAASAGLTLGALDAELFPTEVRGTSNGFLLVCGVAGSATGLLAATTLSGTVGGLGPAIAVCGVASLLAAVVFLPRLPETAARSLDDVSPSEV